MTLEEFKNVKSDDRITHKDTGSIKILVVMNTMEDEGLIYTMNGKVFRYENCQLAEKNELKEFLRTLKEPVFYADEIRGIVIKKFIEELKLPNAKELYEYYQHHAYDDFRKWLLSEIKKIN